MSNHFKIPEPYRSRLPAFSTDVLESWINNPNQTHLSGFYVALLSGDHYRAAAIADDHNLAALGTILLVIGQHYPTQAFGSPHALAAWRNTHT